MWDVNISIYTTNIEGHTLFFFFPRQSNANIKLNLGYRGDLMEKRRSSSDHNPAEIVLASLFLTDSSSSYTKCIRSTFDLWPSVLFSRAEEED